MERERAEQIFLVATIGIFGFLAFLMFKPFLDWVILGFLFAYLFYGTYLWVKKHVRKAGAAAGIMVTVVLLIFFLPFVVILTFLIQDVNEFANFARGVDPEKSVENFLNQTAATFGVAVDSETIKSSAAEISKAIKAEAVEFFTSLLSGLFEFAALLILGLFLFGFTIFYGFVDGPRMLEGVINLVPLRRPEKTELVFEIKRVTDAVFTGHILISFIQAAIGTAGFILLGVPRSVFWGFTMLVTALIPVIGPFIVWVPVGLYLFLVPGEVSSWLPFVTTYRHAALGVLLIIGPVVSTIDNLIRPKIVGKRANVHPFLVLIGALGGLFVFGFTGFVVGPLVLSMLIAVLNVYRKHWTGEAHQRPHRRVHALAEAAELPPAVPVETAEGGGAPPKP